MKLRMKDRKCKSAGVRKVVRLSVCAAAVALLACCGSGESGEQAATRRTSSQGNVQSVLEQEMQKADKAKAESNAAQSGEAGSEGSEGKGIETEIIGGDIATSTSSESTDNGSGSDNAGSTGSEGSGSGTGSGASAQIDVDLTTLSATMVYTEVYNMMYTPYDYVGKNIKMKGLCSVYHDDVTDKYYYACIIMDATACCAQGIEFELNSDYKFPDDYPESNDEICVTGTFDTYYEGEYQYCTLRNARVE